MNERRENGFQPPRVALVLLGLLGAVVLVVAPPGQGWLYGIVGGSLAYLAWRFHGLLVAALVVSLAFVHLQNAPSTDEYLVTCCYLLGLAGGVMAWSVASQQDRWLWAGPICLLTGCVLTALVQQARMLNEIQIRLLQASAVLLLVVGLGGSILLARRIGAIQTLGLFGSAVGFPATVFAGLYIAGLLHTPVLDVTVWASQGNEWRTWAEETLFRNEVWCWAPAWVVGPFLLLGLWRTYARGRQQWHTGEAPLAWLLGIGLLLGIVATLPDDVLLLHLEAIALPLFGLADLGLALVERIQLAPPSPDPANTLRPTT